MISLPSWIKNLALYALNIFSIDNITKEYTLDTTTLKASIDAWAASQGLGADQGFISAESALIAYAETQGKIADAIALLQANGYTVTKNA